VLKEEILFAFHRQLDKSSRIHRLSFPFVSKGVKANSRLACI